MTASARPPPSRLEGEHVRRQKVGEQAFQAGFAELAAEVRQFQQIVQVVNGVAERADFAQLFLCVFQVLLNFLEPRESFLNVLIEFLLHLLGDGHELRVDALANCVETLRGLLTQALKFILELLRGEQKRMGHLAASLGKAAVLLFPARGELLLD
jgi:hypothetical protein